MSRRCRQPSRNGESFDVADARVQLDGNLPDVEVLARRADDHLRGELHPDRPEVEDREDAPSHGAHPAVRIPDVRPMERVEEAGEDRVPDAAQPGHRARLEAAHAVSDDELGSVLELLHEARDLAEVVREVGVDHDDVVAVRRREAGQVGAAVAAPRLVDHDRPGGASEIAAAVGRAVVDDDDLAVEVVLVEHRARGRHALRDRLGLVEARNDDGDAGRRRCGDGDGHFRLEG